MYKLIGVIVAAIPIYLFIRALFPGQSKRRTQVVSDFKKKLDYFVWLILLLIGCGLVYTIVTVILAAR
jgi:hypothetical protein